MTTAELIEKVKKVDPEGLSEVQVVEANGEWRVETDISRYSQYVVEIGIG